MDKLCNKEYGSKGGHVISSKRTQEILQAFGLQQFLVNDPADSKASVQQGHESSVPRPRGDIEGGEASKRKAAEEEPKR